MSCNDPIAMQTIADAVAALLSTTYIERDDPRITNGVFTAPSIRGQFILDPTAKLTFCGLVQECGVIPPYGYVWIERPVYPNRVLISYEDSGETKLRWEPISTQPPIVGSTIPGGFGQWGTVPPTSKPAIVGTKTPTTVADLNTVINGIVATLAAYGLATDSRT